MTLFGVQAALALVTPERFLYGNIFSFENAAIVGRKSEQCQIKYICISLD